MAGAVSALVAAMKLDVELLVGHSAGAAMGVRAVLDGGIHAGAIGAINGASLPLAGPQKLSRRSPVGHKLPVVSRPDCRPSFQGETVSRFGSPTYALVSS